jgi:acyl-CoA reductase-like NAD-dependent aldehyde dehydrogenase
MSTERIVVQRSVAEKFQKLLVDVVEQVFGKNAPAPVLVAAAAARKNRDLVTDALSKGADVVFGDPKASESCANSLRPVIVGGVTKEMDLYSTESFGPTVSLIVVDSEEEAIELANDTEYGLSSAVFTGNLFRGLGVAKQIESGYDGSTDLNIIP